VFGVVHPTAEHHGDALQPACQCAPEVGAAAAVQVDDIRARLANQGTQATQQAHIGVALHGHGVHLCMFGTGLGHGTADGAGQHVLNPLCFEAAHQKDHLQGATVQVHACFHMQHLHACSSIKV